MITALDKKTALVLIDLQKGILQYAPANAVNTVIANAAKLVAAFRKAALPVVVVNVDPNRAAWMKSRKDAPSPIRGTLPPEFMEIVPEIKTMLSDIFITKHTWGAFYETGLHDALQKNGVTGIVLAGVSTSAGVESTARYASELNYNISFAQDAMTDMIPEAHERSIQYIFPRLGETGTTGDIIALLGE